MKELLTGDKAPWARNLIRVGVGYAIGASDPLVIDLIAGAIWALVEAYYIIAKRKGWAT